MYVSTIHVFLGKQSSTLIAIGVKITVHIVFSFVYEIYENLKTVETRTIRV